MVTTKTQRTNENDRQRPSLTTLLILLILFIGFNFGAYTHLWHKMSSKLAKQGGSTQVINKTDSVDKGWITNYIDSHSIPKNALESNGMLHEWLNEQIADARPITNITGTTRPATVSYISTSDVIINDLRPSFDFGPSIDNGELSDRAVSLRNLASSGCTIGQTLKFSGSGWECATDQMADAGNISGVTNRISLFSSSSGLASSYLTQDSTGLWIDGGKDLHVGGTTYGDGSGLYNLNGTQLMTGSVAGSALQSGSVNSNAIHDSAVTTSKLAGNSITTEKLADSVVTLNKLAQSGCGNGQTMKWGGLNWACATDNDQDTVYSAGHGLLLDNNILRIDSSSPNSWAGLQSFGGGLAIGGNTYLDLVGNGLTLVNGVLGTTLGNSIETSELADQAITANKLANSAVTLDKLSQNGCSNSQILKWGGSQWICADETNTTYSAGGGLALASGAFRLDTSAANDWTANQLFSGGITIGGNTYFNLAGAGLAFNGGSLNTVLGNSIDASELDDGAVTANKLTNGTVTLNKLSQNGCTSGQVIKWSGTNWECSSDNNENTIYTTGAGLTLSANTISLDLSRNNTWSGLQDFSSGLVVNGNQYTNLAGTGLVFSNGVLSSSLGALIDNSELADNSITNSKIANGTIALTKLGNNGCDVDQVIKWNGTNWVCIDIHTTTGGSSTLTPYSAGSGLALSNNEFSLDRSHANTWTGTQSFNGGLSLNGTVYTDLAGAGLSFSGGILNAILGNSIDSSEITDGAITSAKLAPGVVTLDKLAQNGCSTGQIITWNGSSWECINNADNDTIYTAGTGLTLNAGSFSIDTSHSHAWSNTQTFSDGITVGGNTYTNLAGSGLTFTGGALSVNLGSSIGSDEIDDNAVTSTKIADGAITTHDLANGAVTANKLAQSGCSDGNVLKWQTTIWMCASDNNTDTDTTYTAGYGIALSGSNFNLDTSHANNWTGLQTFSSGIGIGGSTYTNLAGTGLSLVGSTLTTTLGIGIDTSEISDSAITAAKIANGSITLDKLGANSCGTQQTIKWSGTAWACGNDNDTNTTYTAGTGLLLNAGAFSIDSSTANNWSSNQTFVGGLTIGSNTYTSLAGAGLTFSSGVLSSSLGISIESDEIANGAVTFSKLSNAGCSSSQVLKWNGTSWGCAADTDTTYQAGTGLTLTANTFNLDLARSNNWSGLQTFSSGVNVGGSTYTNLSGSGLNVAGGTLSTSLGTSIETSELVNDAVTSAKILDGTILSADLADGAVTSAKILDGTISGMDIASGTITAANIADGTITAAKQSISARKRVATVSLPSISASLLSSQEYPVFVAPTNGTITKATFTSGNTIVSISTMGTVSVERKTSPASTVASLSLSSVGMTALNPVAPTLGSGLNFSSGDLYTFKYNPGLLGVGINNMLVTIEYIAND